MDSILKSFTADSAARCDVCIAEKLPEITRSYVRKLFDEERITVNKKTVRPAFKVKPGDEVCVNLPEPKELSAKEENIPLDIVYEDDDIIIVNKPKGMVVHPAPGHAAGTLVNALMYHFGKEGLSSINGEFRPGIVHRIDMNTTGILVVCKNDKAHKSLSEQLKVHSITRKYYAIVCNNISEDEGTVNLPIGRHPKDRKKMAINYKNGRDAVTHYKVLERLGNNKYAFIECQLETGRTHQIRVHMASIHHPILGDDVYGPANCPFKLTGQTLHAGVLGFIHPTTGEYVEFKSELPEYFNKLLVNLRGF